MPKFNLYQSLHTTVIGPDGRPLEVQIRTREMHRRAESGIAAHWRYKEGAGLPTSNGWRMRFLHEEYRDPNEFLAGLKLDLYQDEVFVHPAGDVRTLPRKRHRSTSPTPSTPRWGIGASAQGSTAGWSRWGPASSRAT